MKDILGGVEDIDEKVLTDKKKMVEDWIKKFKDKNVGVVKQR